MTGQRTMRTTINLDEDFFDRYTVDPGRDAPGR